MGRFSDFLTIFQYNFGDSWDIHGMRPIILGYFFPTIIMIFQKLSCLKSGRPAYMLSIL